MPLTEETLNELADHLGTISDLVSLHTADPGATGANEVAGGLPAYARQPAVWNAASAGDLTLGATASFDVPAGTTVTHVGVWDADGVTFRGGFALSAAETFSGQGTYDLTGLTVNGSST